MKNLNDTVGQLIKELDDVKQNYLDIRHENEELKKELEIVKSNCSTGDNYLLTYLRYVGRRAQLFTSSALTKGFSGGFFMEPNFLHANLAPFHLSSRGSGS